MYQVHVFDKFEEVTTPSTAPTAIAMVQLGDESALLGATGSISLSNAATIAVLGAAAWGCVGALVFFFM